MAGLTGVAIDEQVDFALLRPGVTPELVQLVFGVLALVVAYVGVNGNYHDDLPDRGFDKWRCGKFQREITARPRAPCRCFRLTAKSKVGFLARKLAPKCGHWMVCGKGPWCAAKVPYSQRPPHNLAYLT